MVKVHVLLCVYKQLVGIKINILLIPCEFWVLGQILKWKIWICNRGGVGELSPPYDLIKISFQNIVFEIYSIGSECNSILVWPLWISNFSPCTLNFCSDFIQYIHDVRLPWLLTITQQCNNFFDWKCTCNAFGKRV